MACAASPSTAISLFGLQINFLDPVNKYYVLMVFAALAMWFQSRILNSPFGAVIEAHPRERAAGEGVRLQRRAQQADRVHAVGRDLVARRLHAGAASVDRAAGPPALPDLGHDRDDGAARRRPQLLRALRRRRELPDPGGRHLAVDAALADLCRRDLRAVRAVPAQGHLGHAARQPSASERRADERRTASAPKGSASASAASSRSKASPCPLRRGSSPRSSDRTAPARAPSSTSSPAR